jgi:hypothetical protein
MAKSKSSTQARWFRAGDPTGWKKDLPQQDRIDLVLASRDYDYLSSARALGALANVTKDPETKRKARADAKKLYAEHNKRTEKIKKSVKKGRKRRVIEIDGGR